MLRNLPAKGQSPLKRRENLVVLNNAAPVLPKLRLRSAVLRTALPPGPGEKQYFIVDVLGVAEPLVFSEDEFQRRSASL